MTKRILFLQGGKAVVLIDVDGLPGIVDPLVAASDGSQVSVVDHVLGQLALLVLVLVLESS